MVDLARYVEFAVSCDAILNYAEAVFESNGSSPLATSVLENLRRSKEIAHRNHMAKIASVNRALRMQMFFQQMMRGRIIAKSARVINPVKLCRVLEDHGSLEEAARCVVLYHNWRNFLTAERWNHRIGGPLPATLEDAITTLQRWQQRDDSAK